MSAAVLNFFAHRLVLGRQALHYIGQGNPVECRLIGICRTGEAQLMKRSKQEITGGIADKGSPRSVCPQTPRSQANQQQARPRVTPVDHRSVVVCGLPLTLGFNTGHQSGTALTATDCTSTGSHTGSSDYSALCFRTATFCHFGTLTTCETTLYAQGVLFCTICGSNSHHFRLRAHTINRCTMDLPWITEINKLISPPL